MKRSVRSLFIAGLATVMLGIIFVPVAAAHKRPWCHVRGSYNSYYKDYDVYVHSNQPYEDARVWQKERNIFGYETGKARCSGRL